ncbi:hypothetical protein ACEQ8H_003506 [Pleosporales sp. CAS-2024a]
MSLRQPSNGPITPRIIIHGGAGNITKKSIPRDLYKTYQASLLGILGQSNERLSTPGITALDVATYAVSLLENDALYNSGHGAVFTRDGENELECSIMISDGYRKRGIGCMMLKHVKNPIKLARELLIRGEHPGGDGSGDHCQYSGDFAEGLAKQWGLEIVDKSYFFTEKRWQEHQRGLLEEKRKLEMGIDGVSRWEKDTYIPMGTCGAVVVDSFGTVCVATSTGGLTNKVPGRIGDTPCMGTGYWAEQWLEDARQMVYQQQAIASPIEKISRGDIGGILSDCLGTTAVQQAQQPDEKRDAIRHAVALSGTGNGDSFIRMAATRSAAAWSRFARQSLAKATTWMVGRNGELQKSAADRWGKTGEGQGGMVGIELVGDRVDVVFDYNCGGLFRAWTASDGSSKCLIFREDSWESGPEGWEDFGSAWVDS